MQSQQVRPISTYDNLGASVSDQLLSNGMPPQPQPELESEEELMNGSGTSHSIAAVKAALNDAKSKFFGINNYDEYESAVQPTQMPMPSVKAHSQQPTIKPEPKYQNVPQRHKPHAADELPAPAPAPTQTIEPVPMPMPMPVVVPLAASSPDRSLRYATTYEQIPLSDLDAPQPSHTVPQNMKGMKIAGRHTPTRNSLRHSRMIVVNHKNHDSLQAAYSKHIRNLNISRQLLIMQLAVGLLIVGLAIWILLLAPNASILINPYLSGLSLLLASIAGLILLRRDHRITEHRAPNSCYKVLLAESYVFSALALVFCCLALVCAAIEFAELASAVDGACGPATSSLLSYHNCTCLTSADDGADDAAADGSSPPNDSEECGAFRGEWKYLLAFSMALNALGIVATFLYITLFICCHRNRKHFYTSV
ncbi:GL15886 [Drosophila persimilis]|uniref:GL15886 n=1 Tax=Drosophila persimilis TaxID=7234 RepID=B4H0Z2_DROPE|nr:GL15886 [Drosophila persimilis]